MSSSGVAKGPQGIIGVSSHGDSIEVADPAHVSEIENLIAERQRIGRQIARTLKRHGLHSVSDDEATVVIDNNI